MGFRDFPIELKARLFNNFCTTRIGMGDRLG